MTVAIMNSVERKNNLYRAMKENDNNLLLKLEYITYTNKLASIIKKMKYYSNQIEKIIICQVHGNIKK